MSKQPTLWMTVLFSKTGKILEYDIETLSYTRKDAIKKCVKPFNMGGLSEPLKWKMLYRYGRRAVKVTLQLQTKK